MKTKKTDYEELYNRVMVGEKVPCWVDYVFRGDEDEEPFRDICICKKTEYNQIVFSVRGHEYDTNRRYEDLTNFIKICNRSNVEYVV